MNVTRYVPIINEHLEPDMEEYRSGDYVAYDDYEDIYDKLADAETELKRLKDKITDIWREI